MRLIKQLLLAWLLVVSPFVFAAPAGNFNLPTLDGGSVSLPSQKGQVVYLDFWATWCGPCRKSFPWMNEMQAKYKNQGLKIIAVSLDSKVSMVKKFLQKYPANFTIALDSEGRVADRYKVAVMPTSYLIDAKGNIIDKHLGFRSRDKDKLEGLIQNALRQ